MKNPDGGSTPEGSWWKKWKGDLEETLRDWGLGERWEEFSRQAQAKLDELQNNPELKARWEEWNSRMDEWQAILREKFDAYLDLREAQQWLDENTQRVRRLFEDVSLRDFVFEPFKEVFATPESSEDDKIRSVITQVAVVNAVLAGLPARLGVGIYVCLALEAWMAYVIARSVGVEVRRPADVWKYFGLLAGTAATILWLFRHLLGFAFSLFSIVPEVNPLIFAELFVTDLVGVLFWIGFQEAKKDGSFRVPTRLLLAAWERTTELCRFQLETLKNVLSLDNIMLVGKRIHAWFTGGIPVDNPTLRGEVFSGVALSYLMTSGDERLQGPMGQMFIESIRARYPDLADASVAEIADRFREYDLEQLQGVYNMLKGEMFERLVAAHENADGDTWTAHLHEDRSYPGSDIIFTDEGGNTVEVSLKASDSVDYIEEALLRYPDIPIITTTEVASEMADEDMVFAGPFSHAHVKEVTQENFEQLFHRLDTLDTVEAVGGSAAAKAAWGLWPFVVAYFRKRITYEQLELACERVLGEMGKSLVARIPYALVFGPVFAWYLLARVVMMLTRAATNIQRDPIYLSCDVGSSTAA